MKEKELRKLANCHICGEPIGRGLIPMFSRFTIERFILDGKALQRKAGLEMVVGSPALAMVMGPDEDLAKSISKKIVGSICAGCIGEPIEQLEEERE